MIEHQKLGQKEKREIHTGAQPKQNLLEMNQEERMRFLRDKEEKTINERFKKRRNKLTLRRIKADRTLGEEGVSRRYAFVDHDQEMIDLGPTVTRIKLEKNNKRLNDEAYHYLLDNNEYAEGKKRALDEAYKDEEKELEDRMEEARQLFNAGKYKESEQAREQRKQRKQEIEDEKSKVKENLSAFFSTTDTEGNKKLIRSFNAMDQEHVDFLMNMAEEVMHYNFDFGMTNPNWLFANAKTLLRMMDKALALDSMIDRYKKEKNFPDEDLAFIVEAKAQQAGALA